MSDFAALPRYTYIPGGPWPHPNSNPDHSPVPDAEDAAFERGCFLFDCGFYWEAHEVWERLWHAHGRRGSTALLLQALIKLAASGVKVRQHQPHGVRTHASRAAQLLAGLAGAFDAPPFGLDLDALRRAADHIAADPPETSLTAHELAAVVLPIRLRPSTQTQRPGESEDPPGRSH